MVRCMRLPFKIKIFLCICLSRYTYVSNQGPRCCTPTRQDTDFYQLPTMTASASSNGRTASTISEASAASSSSSALPSEEALSILLSPDGLVTFFFSSKHLVLSHLQNMPNIIASCRRCCCHSTAITPTSPYLNPTHRPSVQNTSPPHCPPTPTTPWTLTK